MRSVQLRALWVGDTTIRQVARATLRRTGLTGRAPRRPRTGQSREEIGQAAAAALGRAPAMIHLPSPALYEHYFPGAIARYRRRAERILEHHLEIFGREHFLGSPIDWSCDLLGNGDRKGPWELQRGAHLVELACAARLCPELAWRARVEIA